MSNGITSRTKEGRLLKSINTVASSLMYAKPDIFFQTVWKSLETIGTVVGAHRAYIWQNFEQDGEPYCGQTHEWSEGAEPQQGNDIVSALPFKEVPYWWDCVQKGIPINSAVCEMPPEERAVLEPQGIVSILVLPIMMDGVSWGFIGFDDCINRRVFPKVEEELLLTVGTLIASAITRNDLIHDLEDQITAAQRASEASEFKSTFLARTSHEIRTPMNAITGMAELVLREKLAPDVRSYVLDIKQAGQSLLSIINDILDFSKIESGKLEIVPVSYRLSSLLNDVITIIRMRAAKKGLYFTVNIDSSLPDELMGDMVRIRQTLINILDNAVKYTPQGYVDLRVTGGKDDKGGVSLSVFVEDSGMGIKKEDYDLLFKDFIQLDMKKNQGIVGNGLGLAISKSLMQAMDGDITVESEYGKGSTFRIDFYQKVQSGKSLAVAEHAEGKLILLLAKRDRVAGSIQENCASLFIRCDIADHPEEFHDSLKKGGYSHILVAPCFYGLAAKEIARGGCTAKFVFLTNTETRPHMPQAQTLPLPVHVISLANLLNDVNMEETESGASSVFQAPRARVLVVDDNKTNLKVAAGLLKPYRMNVDICESGRRACQLVEDNDYDLVFIDHMMPDMDGIEATKRIRGMGEKLPIIALTANAISGMQELFLKSGMNGFLPKPIDVSKLHAELDRWIPAEKKQSVSDAEQQAEAEAPIIGGVDTVAGMRRIGGSRDEYFVILESYCSEADSLVKAIRECLAEDDLARFTIYVHSLKSAAATIGANHITQEAERLETAGNAMDKETVQDSIDGFLSGFIQQTETIRKALADQGQQKRDGSESYLKTQAGALLQALDSLDMRAAHRVLDDLENYQWPGPTGKLLQSLSGSILLSDLDEAQSCVKAILGNY